VFTKHAETSLIAIDRNHDNNLLSIIKEWATQYIVISEVYGMNKGYIIDCSGQCLEFGSSGLERCVATLAVPDGCRDVVPRTLNVKEFQ
jgi:hypothetical protein